MSFLTAQNVDFIYKSRESNNFELKNINLEIRKEDFLSILGPNGSGKTTLIKLFVRLLKPDKGTISLNGKPFNNYSGKELFRNISYVPQKFISIFPFTVEEILLMGRTPHLNLLGFEKHEDIERVNEILNEFNISHLRNKSVNKISGGELQKVIIARSIVQDTPVLILDEPNSHLDLKHQNFIFKILKKLNEKGKTIISISHDINLAINFSNRIVLMKDGGIFFDGKTEDALKENYLEKVFGTKLKFIENPSDSGNSGFVVNIYEGS